MLTKMKAVAAIVSALGFSVSAHAAVQTFSFTTSTYGSGFEGSAGPYDGLPVTVQLTYDVDQQSSAIAGAGTDNVLEYYKNGTLPVSVLVNGPLGKMTGTVGYTRGHYVDDDPRDPFTAFDQYIFTGYLPVKPSSDTPSGFFSFNFLLNSLATPVGSPTSLSVTPVYNYEFAVSNGAHTAASYKGFQGGFDSSDVSPVVPAVPEPATWGMMLLGVGLVGGVMRHRHNVSKRLAVA